MNPYDVKSLPSSPQNRHQRMSAVDAAWLRMEIPKNQMSILGVIYLDPAPELNRFLEVLEERLIIHERFRQKVVLRGNNPYWEFDSNFNISNHVKTLEHHDNNLDTFISSLMGTVMDFSKPLWEIYLIPNTDKGMAVVGRIHHCIADGIALISTLLSFATVTPNGPYFDQLKEYPARDKNYEKGFKSGFFNFFREIGLVAKSLVKFIIMPSDTLTQLKGPLGLTKKAAWSKSFSLENIKKCANHYNATINDMLLWFTCSALRTYLLRDNSLQQTANLRVTMPVNLRKKSDLQKFGNKFGVVFLTLPIGEADSLERLRNIQLQMHDIKDSREAVVAYGVLALLGRAPKFIEDFFVNFLSSKCSAVVTNVPGPRKELFIAGSCMKDIMFWVPKSGKLGLGISLISYNSKVTFGLATDIERVGNPSEIIDLFEQEVEKELFKLSD